MNIRAEAGNEFQRIEKSPVIFVNCEYMTALLFIYNRLAGTMDEKL